MIANSNLLNKITPAELYQGRARVRHFDFMQYCWQRPDPFIEAKENGFQRAICSRIDKAIKDYSEGVSSFLCINVAFGHGKSDSSSRYLPPHFLGMFPDHEVLVVSHTDDKANEFGAFGRMLVQSKEYLSLYPQIRLSSSNHGVQEWGIAGHHGKAQYIGIGSGTAGKRGNLIIVDDFFGKREHAESAGIRDKVWQSFTDDIMTRRAPTTIVLMVVTPWHVDDPIGRLKKKMEQDENFPRFEFLSFPAFSDQYPSGTLFPERFDRTWYDTQRSFLGPYGTASLMQCDPQIKLGNRIRVDKVHIVSEDGACSCGQYHQWPGPEVTRARAWDIASSKKETTSADPDYSVGVRLCLTQEMTAISGLVINSVWIEDVVRGQWEAPQRQRIIRDTAMADGHIEVGIEAFAGYKDAYSLLESELRGIRMIRKMQLPGDKVAKASVLEPIFEAGNVYMKRAMWNDAVIKVIADFPGGAHDDDVDAIAVGYNMLVGGCQLW